MHVRVFRNLHTQGFSIQRRIAGRWRTLGHAQSVRLRDGVGHVQAGGRNRVLSTGHKTVHAWIEGTLEAWVGTVRLAGLEPPVAQIPPINQGCRVRYNPTCHDTFVDSENRPIKRRQVFVCTAPGQVWASWD